MAGTWKNGDRIEVEFDATTTLEAVDPQHPELVAIVNGPLALFAVGAVPSTLRREDLLGAKRISIGSNTWQARTQAGTLLLKPFSAIDEEGYRLYHQIEA
jgi:DUF1680 family protein